MCVMCRKTSFLISFLLVFGLTAGIGYAARIPIPAGFPNASNTGIAGVGLTEEDLTTYTGPYTITTDDTVVDKKLLSGQINIQADNVTIKRCKNTSGGSWYGLNANYGYTGTIVEDCTFVGPATLAVLLQSFAKLNLPGRVPLCYNILDYRPKSWFEQHKTGAPQRGVSEFNLRWKWLRGLVMPWFAAKADGILTF
jgi:hypothetical protein